MLKNRYFWPFLAKMGKKGLFAGYTPKMAILALFGAPEGLVLHQPLAAGPCAPAGVPGVPPGWGSPHRGEGRIPAFLTEASALVGAETQLGKEVVSHPWGP